MKAFILCIVCLVGITYSFYIDEWLTENKEEISSEANIWVLLVAGSNGWYNYRHQADICHLYHLLTKKHGIPPQYIVNMQYNDIAYSHHNPHPGQIINALHGKDVYQGNMIDYMGDTVTPQNFLKILSGIQVHGGSGKVIESGPNDYVFVNFVDHGGPGILGFPEGELHVADLTRTLEQMYHNRRYKQMLWYVEACYSGSMFASSLSPDMNITAHTASNTEESSYACVLDEEMHVYLGDCWSLNWMNNTEAIFPELESETVGQQYEIVKKMTTKSHASIYGDLNIIYNEPISMFMGHGPKAATPATTLTNMNKDSIPSPDVMLDYLRRKLARTDNGEEARSLELQISYHETTEEKVQVLLDDIVFAVTGSVDKTQLIKQEYATRIDDPECNKAVLETFFSACYKRHTHPYIIKYITSLTMLCNMDNYRTEQIVEAIVRNCNYNSS